MGNSGSAAELATARRTGEQLVEGLLESAPDAMLVFDSAGLIVRANTKAAELFGYARGQLLSQPISILFPGDVLAGASDARFFPEDLLARGGELVGFDGAGRQFPVELNLHPLPTDEGMLVCASVRDITGRVEAAESLSLAENRFRGAFDQAPIGMALVALDGRFVKVNRSLCELVGFTERQLLELTFADITHPDDLDADLAYVARVLRGEIRTYQMEKRYIDAAGEVLWINLSVSLVRDPAGRPLHFISQIQDISERRGLEEQLRHLAEHDPLTGLLNRRGLEVELERHVARAARKQATGALIIVDLDHFKSINDTLGHGAGDELIVAVADMLTGRLRTSDIVARLGGDEFAILLPGADAEQAGCVAEQVISEIRGQSVCLGGRHQQRVTASIGVTLLSPAITTVADALVAADLAMYEAKEAGRDRISISRGDRQVPGPGQSRLAWIQRIRTSIREDRFTFHLQPILDLHTGEIRQHEVLLRMLGEQGEVIGPGAFLPVAERFGLIGEIDRWVVRRSMTMIADAAARGERLVLEVNLSGKSLGDPLLLETIEQGLGDRRIDPQCLIFEVTETAAVANIHVARDFASELSELGCRFALDDFGAGFGSFYYLKHLPADYLKIDGEFVTRCVANRTDQFVIKALVGIAQGLGKQTVAECVEDGATLEFLRRNGVDFAQGYHIGAPAPIVA